VSTPTPAVVRVVPPAWINGIELSQVILTATPEVVRLRGPRPDPSWQHIDSSGHFHAFTADGRLPTLERRSAHPADPDDDGDGYEHVPTWHACVICGDEVAPRMLPDSEFLPPVRVGPTRYELEAMGPARLFDLVGQRATFTTHGRFGIGMVDMPESFEVSSGDPRAIVRMRLDGLHERDVKPLGKPEPKRPNLARAIAAGADALHPTEFAHLAADRAIRAALAHLGLDAEGNPL
jgi:hypothetical protein